MQMIFTIPKYFAIADLISTDLGVVLTRINVPQQHRKKGIGSQLLKEVITEADKTKTTIWLQVLSSGGLNRSQLISWYKRYGFEFCSNTTMKRKPQDIKQLALAE